MRIAVKICGISTPEAMAAAVAGGARYVGLVFYPPSPRAVVPQLAAELARGVPTGVRAVGLFVDPTDALLSEVAERVPLDLIQLHGRESPERTRAVRELLGIPVMKAVKIAGPDDVAAAAAFETAADMLLFDAKPPPGIGLLPGGNGLAFDWQLLAGHRWPVPWMLSGGLTAGCLAEAVTTTGAEAVDVSSGVEDRPGHKPPAMIRAFLEAASAL